MSATVTEFMPGDLVGYRVMGTNKDGHVEFLNILAQVIRHMPQDMVLVEVLGTNEKLLNARTEPHPIRVAVPKEGLTVKRSH